MQAVTILLVSAAMAGGGDWPDDANSSRNVRQQPTTTASGQSGLNGAPPSPLRYSANGVAQSTYDNEFNAGTASRVPSSTTRRGGTRRNAVQTEFTLPDLTGNVQPTSSAIYDGGTANRGNPAGGNDYQSPRETAQGNAYRSSDFTSPTTETYRTSMQEDDQSEENSGARYIPPSQLMSPNSTRSRNLGSISDPQTTAASNPYYGDSSSTGLGVSTRGQEAPGRDEYQNDRGGYGRDNPTNSYSPLNPNLQQQPPLPGQRQLPQLPRQQAIYSAQNPEQSPIGNPLVAVSDSVGTAATAAKRTVESGARRIGGVLDTGAQTMARESQRQGNSYFLTLLALFGSVGLNLYLGWIAWDTYNRYQDLVSDMRFTGSRRGNEYDDRYENKAALAEPAAY